MIATILQDVPAPAPTGSYLDYWPWAVGALVVAALAVVAWKLWKREEVVKK